MCESVEIRYVHFMKHPDYPDILGVGCICAEHMEGDYVNPRIRENKVRSQVRRRQAWANRKWRISTKGNLYLNTEGFNLTVFKTSDRRRNFWGLQVTNRQTGKKQTGHHRYMSEDEAKNAALTALLWAKEHL